MLVAAALLLAGTKPEIFMKGDLDWLLSCMAWITATAMLLKDMWCCIRTVAFLKMKLKIMFVKAVDVRQFRPNF